MRHIGLFEGIGGFSYAVKQMNWETIAWCENNPFCQTILKHHYPNAKAHGDIKTTDFTIYAGECDIVTAGFPCQPASHAGKRKGLEDERWLWPATRRAYRQIKPAVLILENVAGLLSILEPESLSEVEKQEIKLFYEDEDYLSKTIERVKRKAIGTIIEQVRQDGYVFPEYSDGTPIVFCIPACAVNAPHRRDRIWLVAYAKSSGNRRELRGLESENDINGQSQEYRQNHNQYRDDGEKRDAANSNSNVHARKLDRGGITNEEKRSKGENEQQNGWCENRKRLRAKSGAGSEDATYANQLNADLSEHGTSEIPQQQATSVQQCAIANTGSPRCEECDTSDLS